MRRLCPVLFCVHMLSFSVTLFAADMSKTVRVAMGIDVTGFDRQVTLDDPSSYLQRSIFDTPARHSRMS